MGLTSRGHHEWVREVVARHDEERPFAPENGEPLKFKVGDQVIYTNDYGATFKLAITGFYQPTEPCSLYACGARYLLDWDCPWFPVKEAQLQHLPNRYKELMAKTPETLDSQVLRCLRAMF